MKTSIFLFLFLFVNLYMTAQPYIREVDSKTKKVVLRGELTFDNILKESTCKWLSQGEQAYQPDETKLEPLSQLAKDYHFVVVLGTWCEDTHNLLPKFYKLVNESLLDFNSIQLFGVNRAKEALNTEKEVFKIERVPTFIVFHQNREVGRITESVAESLEADLVNIMQKDAEKLAKEREERLKVYMQDTRKY